MIVHLLFLLAGAVVAFAVDDFIFWPEAAIRIEKQKSAEEN
jgi:hypothetical protein